jgi:hypothetical protein
MSKQFHLYLLPADIESLMQTLRSKLEFSIVRSSSPQPFPVQMESPLISDRLKLKEGTVRADCYIVPSQNQDIKMKFIPTLSFWDVQIDSEAIEFEGCEFDGSVLLRGRFYFQTDRLVDGLILPKRTEFLSWADNVFRTAKKSLQRSTLFDAYVGEHAERWRQEGGRFAWTATHSQGPVFER